MQHGAADAALAIDQPVEHADRFDAMIETTGSLAFATSQLPRIRSGGDVFAYAIYPEMGDESAFSPLGQDHHFARIDPREAEATTRCARWRNRADSPAASGSPTPLESTSGTQLGGRSRTALH